jgi:hypothetical protein
MKKIFTVLMLALALFIAGCDKQGNIEEGGWMVVSTDYPEILAEKNGKVHVFSYRPSWPQERTSTRLQAARFKRIKPGWLVVVDASGDYSFFPPTE